MKHIFKKKTHQLCQHFFLPPINYGRCISWWELNYILTPVSTSKRGKECRKKCYFLSAKFGMGMGLNRLDLLPTVFSLNHIHWQNNPSSFAFTMVFKSKIGIFVGCPFCSDKMLPFFAVAWKARMLSFFPGKRNIISSLHILYPYTS